MSEKEKITLNGKEYVLDELSVENKSIVQSLKFVDQEIVQTEARLSVLKTAQSAYGTALMKELEK
jgi:hypothetical protein